MSPDPAAPSLAELQSGLRAALLGGEAAALLPLIEPDRIPAGERLDCHRRNVSAGLVEVLAAAFPATQRHAGEANFRFAAGRFLRDRPPAEPRLLAYGAAFPDWLAGFAPARDKPWLAALARLEWARCEALFAADAVPLQPASLAGIAPEAVAGLRFELHPSLRLLRAEVPLHELWLGERPAEEILAAGGAQDLLVLRPAWQVVQLPVARGDAVLLAALGAGATLGEAAGAALAEAADLDLQQTLFGHLVRGSFAAVRPPAD